MTLLKYLLGVLLSISFATVHATVEVADDEYVVFYAQDMLGSPVAVSDDQGRVLWYENTEPYGKSLNRYSQSGELFPDSESEESDTRLGYTGHERDSGSGLTYMKARFYDPSVGRFYSDDPFGFSLSRPATFNRYAYAANNPYRYIDPDGKDFLDAYLNPSQAMSASAWGARGTVRTGKTGFTAIGGIVFTSTAALTGFALHKLAVWQKGKDEDTVRGSDKNRPISEPVDLEEDLAGQEIVSGLEQGNPADIEEKRGGWLDDRYDPETGTHDKVKGTHDHPDGTTTVVHGDRNRETNELSDLKFKNPPDNNNSRSTLYED